MTDSVGDGWNETILLLHQNYIVGTFGETFKTGYLINPVYILVKANVTCNIFVSQLGSATSEIGFIVKSPNGTTIYQRTNGTAFTSSTVFASFCLMGGCPPPTTLNLTITMTS